MFRKVKPYKRFLAPGDRELTPKATLSDEFGGLCHIVEEDGCYVSYLYTDVAGFTPTHFIFPELFLALRELEPLDDLDQEND